MIKITIYIVGKKSREKWLEEGINCYENRLKGSIKINWVWCKDNSLLIAAANQCHAVALDANGDNMSSEKFSPFLIKNIEKGGSRLAFIIGGADGLPEEIKNNFPLISLSKMTFTHQMARLLLVEQIYRAIEIAKGSPYHK